MGKNERKTYLIIFFLQKNGDLQHHPTPDLYVYWYLLAKRFFCCLDFLDIEVTLVGWGSQVGRLQAAAARAAADGISCEAEHVPQRHFCWGMKFCSFIVNEKFCNMFTV